MVSNLLLFLFLLFIPTQLGRHFWPSWSLVQGIRVDYLAPTLYLVDIIWILLIISNVIPKGISHGSKFPRIVKNWRFWITIVFIAVNILGAMTKEVAIIRWLRIGEWGIILLIAERQKLKVKSYLKMIIPVWLVVEVGLGLGQVFGGGSVGGLFYWLGERSFTSNTPGVALLSVFGHEMVRAYGTFSHPNSLAGFLLVTLLLWQKIKGKSLKINLFVWTLGLLGIAICGSRMIWILTVLCLIKDKKWWLVLGGLGILVSSWLGGWDVVGISKRIDLIEAALRMWWSYPLFGVGAGNFLVALPLFRKTAGVFWLQPVHMVPLLWLAEFGIGGILLLISNLIPKGISQSSKFLMTKKILTNKLFWVVVVTSLVDHYWWTLPQNWWLMAVVFGLMR